MEEVRPHSGREAGLGHVRREAFQVGTKLKDERYFAIEHMEEVRPHSGREAGLGHVRREAFQVGTKLKDENVLNLTIRQHFDWVTENHRASYPVNAGLYLLTTQFHANSNDRPRACHRILKVSRTIADLDGATNIQSEQVAEAIAFRRLNSTMDSEYLIILRAYQQSPAPHESFQMVATKLK